jgi:hypothetical protein
MTGTDDLGLAGASAFVTGAAGGRGTRALARRGQCGGRFGPPLAGIHQGNAG